MIKTLETRVKEMATSYYEGCPIASDSVFDKTLDELRSLDPNNKILSQIGWGYEVKGEKRPHRIQTSGLGKIKESDPSYFEYKDFLATPKYDGISCTLYYDDKGKLEEALTRGGDSGLGKPITHNIIKAAKRDGLDLVDSSVLAVTCEIVVRISDFQKHLSNSYELPRSAAAGIAQTQSPHPDAQYLEICPFRIHLRDGREIAIQTLSSLSVFESYLGRDFPYHIWTNNTKDLESWVNKLDYPQDGVVLGDLIALKFDTEIVETEVTSIERKVTRLGNIIPVLNFKPVRLYGTTVSRCTMVNERWIESSHVGSGALIKITKANQIIPQYLETVKSVPYSVPTQCPQCKGPVYWIGDHLVCRNRCQSEISRIYSFVFTFGELLGYSEATLAKILNVNHIQTFSGLLRRLGSLEGSGLTDHELVFLNHLNNIFNNSLEIESLLVSLNLPGIGKTWSEKLADHLEYYLKLDYSKLKIEFPFTVNYNVINSLEENYDLIQDVYKRFKWVHRAKSTRQDSIKVTITGKLSMTKDEFCEKYNLVQVSLNDSRLLIYADSNSKSNKMQVAQKIGARILSESEFIKEFCN